MNNTQLVKEILNLAGYDIIFLPKGYIITKDGIKISAGSTVMTPKAAIEFITRKSYDKGFLDGESYMKNSFKALLDIKS